MTAVHSSLARLLVAVRQFLTAIGQKNAPAICFWRRRDPGLFPAIGADLAGSATPDKVFMKNTIKLGNLVLPPGDPPLTGARPWRDLNLYLGQGPDRVRRRGMDPLQNGSGRGSED
ncbi:MAG: hypothetical protein ABSH35_07980 [Isosphaeraceae bacterium]|jgi:hypothetical protein